MDTSNLDNFALDRYEERRETATATIKKYENMTHINTNKYRKMKTRTQNMNIKVSNVKSTSYFKVLMPFLNSNGM